MILSQTYSVFYLFHLDVMVFHLFCPCDEIYSSFQMFVLYFVFLSQSHGSHFQEMVDKISIYCKIDSCMIQSKSIFENISV